ncbi:MAG: CpsD/CapB family tyrosine-protein kinase [Planctomycetes bacterium]|nr:CpsD/CapB family tyrosine-protein kinase [Planctomycetota bacterium]
MTESPQEILSAPSKPGRLNELPGANQRGEFLRLLPKLRDLAGLGNPIVVCMTSSIKGEGTTTVAAQFAVAVADSGSGDRVVLIDGNQEHPEIHELLGLQMAPGLTEVCNHGVPMDQAIQSTELNTLDVLTVGRHESKGPSFLNSLRFQEIVAQLEQKYDVVIIDCPPLSSGHGTTQLSKKDAMTALIIEASQTKREVIEGALHELELMGANVVGVILNRRQFFVPSFVYRRL